MITKGWWAVVCAVLVVAISIQGGMSPAGWSLLNSAIVFGSLSIAAVAVLLGMVLRMQTRQLALQREELKLQREQVNRLTRNAARTASAMAPDKLPADSDPRLFLRPENSLGDSAVVFILKNNGAQIWGVSMYWHHREHAHFIDETYPTLETGEEIIAFVQRTELPPQFGVIVSYTRRDGSEQEERWSIVVDSAGFDCSYEGKVNGGLMLFPK